MGSPGISWAGLASGRLWDWLAAVTAATLIALVEGSPKDSPGGGGGAWPPPFAKNLRLFLIHKDKIGGGVVEVLPRPHCSVSAFFFEGLGCGCDTSSGLGLAPVNKPQRQSVCSPSLSPDSEQARGGRWGVSHLLPPQHHGTSSKALGMGRGRSPLSLTGWRSPAAGPSRPAPSCLPRTRHGA